MPAHLILEMSHEVIRYTKKQKKKERKKERKEEGKKERKKQRQRKKEKNESNNDRQKGINKVTKIIKSKRQRQRVMCR